MVQKWIKSSYILKAIKLMREIHAAMKLKIKIRMNLIKGEVSDDYYDIIYVKYKIKQ